MENGVPFLKEAALERINKLADNLEITQQEAEELTTTANNLGVDILPIDAMRRIDKLEESMSIIMTELKLVSGGPVRPGPPVDNPPKLIIGG